MAGGVLRVAGGEGGGGGVVSVIYFSSVEGAACFQLPARAFKLCFDPGCSIFSQPGTLPGLLLL
jgi:hypothetical protein